MMMRSAAAMGSAQLEDLQPDLFTGHQVKIEIFEGPLDLLLYLVKRSEVDIYEVPLAEITDDYLSYLHALEELNIELVGEFLVVAAALLLIKSRMLLPVEQARVDDEEEAEELDPHQELAQRLLEYRTFRDAAELLAESRQLRERIYLRALAPGSEVGTGYVLLEDVSVFDLVTAFRELLARAEAEPVQELPRRRYTVADQIRAIQRAVASGPPEGVTFLEVLTPPLTKALVIVTFLAVLELMRRQRIRVIQEHSEAPIRMVVREAPSGGGRRRSGDGSDTPRSVQRNG